MMEAPVKVLYIAGFERSGSTILQNVLGQMPGFTAIGEARYFWDELEDGTTLCGCGALVRECDFWNRVLSSGFGEPGRIPLQDVIKQRERKQRDLLPMLLGRDRSLAARMHGYLGCLDTFYRTICQLTGSKVIIDSSKSPLYSYTLGMIGSLDVFAVHLVRDPMGVAHSIMKRKAEGHPSYRNWNIGRVALSWTIWNTAIGLLWRKKRQRLLMMRYEDFIRSPRAALEKIMPFICEEAEELPFKEADSVIMRSTHTIGGSPSRFKLGVVKLEPDRRWQWRLTQRQRLAVKLWTMPLRRRYGY